MKILEVRRSRPPGPGTFFRFTVPSLHVAIFLHVLIEGLLYLHHDQDPAETRGRVGKRPKVLAPESAPCHLFFLEAQF